MLHLRMPAEWEPHQATWLSWLHNSETWYPSMMDAVLEAYVQIIAALAYSETVHINVNDAEMEQQARSQLLKAHLQGDIHFHHTHTNDAWCRDHGGVCVYATDSDMAHAPQQESLMLIDWEYNAWGGKYPPYHFDNLVPAMMAEYLNVERIEGGMVLEGGSIEVNGKGILLTTESCLLNPNRNPQLTREQIEERLCTRLGVQRILWLGDGIVGDDTDGHVDDITRFVNPHTIVTVVEEDPSDDNYAPLQENLSRLQHMRGLDGKPFRIVPLPMPDAVWYEDMRLPASYANFYIANKVVLLPTYRCAADQQVQRILQELFPNREVIGIDCTDIVFGLGAIHCLTQQVPIRKGV